MFKPDAPKPERRQPPPPQQPLAFAWPQPKQTGLLSEIGLRFGVRAYSKSASPQVVLEEDSAHSFSGQSKPVLWEHAALKEVEIARQFNQPLPLDPVEALEQLEEAITSLMSVRQQVILWFEDSSATYVCLNDEKNPEQRPREMTRLCDDSLKAFLQNPDKPLLSSPLVVAGRLVGLVLVADPSHKQAFNSEDEAILEGVARYLAPQVLMYQTLKESQFSPYVQQVLLDLSEQLVGAVNRNEIIQLTLFHLCKALGFDVGQFIQLDNEAREGLLQHQVRLVAPAVQVSQHIKQPLSKIKRTFRQNNLNEVDATQAASSFLKPLPQALSDSAAYTPERSPFTQQLEASALLETPTAILEAQGLAGLLSLFASTSWQSETLHIKGPSLGGLPLSNLFHVPETASALVIPLRQTEAGKFDSFITLLALSPKSFLPKTAQAIAAETTRLMGRAVERSMVLEQAMHLASSDELTGLRNRRVFYERFELEMLRAKRNNAPMSVAIVDVDHFKRFNDTYGHLTGDMVLRHLGGLFRQNTRKTDLVARFGGEEFVFLLPDTDGEKAQELMDRLRAKVACYPFLSSQGDTLEVTMSVGVAPIHFDEDKPATNGELPNLMAKSLALADEALYTAKESGRNKTVLAAAV